MKIHLVGAELFQAGGKTDGLTHRTKLRAAFRNFGKALKTGPNKMTRLQKQSEYTGSAESMLQFYSVGDRFEYRQGHRQHRMRILVNLIYGL
jgi:hypothetical protein